MQEAVLEEANAESFNVILLKTGLHYGETTLISWVKLVRCSEPLSTFRLGSDNCVRI